MEACIALENYKAEEVKDLEERLEAAKYSSGLQAKDETVKLRLVATNFFKWLQPDKDEMGMDDDNGVDGDQQQIRFQQLLTQLFYWGPTLTLLFLNVVMTCFVFLVK